jgi:hypothetical protein
MLYFRLVRQSGDASDGRSRPSRASIARIVATSSAALLESPAPTGTSEAIPAEAPVSMRLGL